MNQINIRTTPEQIDSLEPNHIFVFGSNLAGIHGAGAAKIAREKFGAKMGVGIGISGVSYALPTKDEHLCTLKPSIIQAHVFNFIEYARQHSDMTFLITPVGCGLAGLTGKVVGPMFADVPDNCILPRLFQHELGWPYLEYQHGVLTGGICQKQPSPTENVCWGMVIHNIEHSKDNPLRPPYLLPESKVRASFAMYGKTYEAVPVPTPLVPDVTGAL